MVCGGIILIQFGNPLLRKVEKNVSAFKKKLEKNVSAFKKKLEKKDILFNLILKEIKGYIFAQLFLKVDLFMFINNHRFRNSTDYFLLFFLFCSFFASK